MLSMSNSSISRMKDHVADSQSPPSINAVVEPSLSLSPSHSNPRLQRFESSEPVEHPQYTRRFSDMAAISRVNASALAGVEENPPIDRPRRSLDGADLLRTELPIEPNALPDVVIEAMLLRGKLARANSHTETAADSKGKRYAEMMERFQIRRVTRSPSLSAVGAANSVRDATERPSSVNSVHESFAAQQSTTPQIPPLPSLAGRSERAYTDIRGQSEGDATLMTPRGSMHSSFVTRTGRSGRLSIFWWFVSWKRRLVRDLEYVKHNIRRPIAPSSWISRVRLAVMMLAFTVHVVVFPLETAFLPEEDGFKDIVGCIEVAVEIVLVIDFLLMFNTSFYNKRNVLVQSRKAIAKHYLRTWFLLDLASSVPVDLIVMATDDNSIETRWIHLVYDVAVRSQRVVHVIRVARYMWTLLLDSPERSMFEWLLYSRYSHLFRIAWIILFIILIAHYLACGWKLLAIATVHGAAHAETTTRSPLEEYVANFYDVLQLLQGQGVPTTSVGQNMYATIAILMGSVALAIIFGHVAILVSNFNANSTNYQRKMESVFAIMSKLQLPAPLRERIHQYYEHLWREYESLDGEIVSFSKGLSHTLELEVVLFKYMDLIMHVPFWRNGSPDFQKQLMLHLSVRVYLPDDFIIRRGEVGEEFFMINRGVCELVLGPDSFECTTEPLPDDEDSSFSDSENNPDEGASMRTARFEAHTARYAESEETPVKFRRGRRGSRANMYKPGGGSARVAAEPSSKYIQKLRRGQAFGELALFMNYERTANVRALTYVEMCVLQRRDFQKILVKHPADRKHVLTSMLTKTMENNEATKVWCPLKAMVHSVFSEGEPQKAESLSAMHAALLISSAVNLPLDDESIKFGIGERLRDQLVELRDKQRQGSTPTRSTASTTPVRRRPSSQDAGETQPTQDTVQSFVDVHRLTEHVQQLEHVQTTMSMTLMDLSREVHTLRATNERLYQLVGSYESRLVELLHKPQGSSDGLRSKRRQSRDGGSAKPQTNNSVLIRPRQSRVPLHRQRSASMSSLNTSRGDMTTRQPQSPVIDDKCQELTQTNRQTSSPTNRRASFAATRSSTVTNLTGTTTTDAKLKPRPHHLGPIEGVARSAFYSVKSLLTAESETQEVTSPTKYADQLFESKATPSKK